MQVKTVQLLGMTDTNMDDVSEAASFISLYYSAESDRNMLEQRYKVWLSVMIKAYIYMYCSPLKSLPLTSEAFGLNSLFPKKMD